MDLWKYLAADAKLPCNMCADDNACCVLARAFGTNRQSVAEPWQRLNKDRIVGVIVEREANLANRVTQCFVAALTRSPGALQQRFARNEVTGRARKT